MPPKNEGQPLSPYQVLMSTFEYFMKDELDEESLVKCALEANCPRPEVAIAILNQLIAANKLTKETRDGVVYYKKVIGSN